MPPTLSYMPLHIAAHAVAKMADACGICDPQGY